MEKYQNNSQFRDLSIDEMQIITGGSIWRNAILGAIAVYDAASDFIDGFKQGWNEAKNQKK